MASRRVEKLKLQGGSGAASSSGIGGNIQIGNVQINTSVDDTQKSIDELINAGLAGARSHEQNRNHFQRKKMPLSFFNPRTGTSAGGKSRGSSAGHSREGSSDDGGGRHTLSPTASAFSASTATPLFGGGGVPGAQIPMHQRQASAPALINYNIADQPQPPAHQMLFVASNRHRPMAGGGAAALPPVAHFHSKSLNTVTMNSAHMAPSAAGGAMLGHIPFGAAGSAVGGSSLVLPRDGLFGGVAAGNAQLPPIAHQRSVKSCDFDAVGIGANGGFHQGFSGFGGGGGGVTMDASSQLTPTQPYGDVYHSTGYMGQQQAASYQHIHQPHQHHPMFGSQHAMPPASAMSQGGIPFHAVHHRAMTETATGDLAASVEFHANKAQQPENLYWMNPRGKSQSLDPISLTAAAEGASPLAPGASPITAPGSMASVNSAATSTSQQQQQQQQFLLQQQQQSLGMASCSGNSMDDGLGPLPDGWAMSYDQNGDPYFIDHFNKTTTWYDPRISREAQEETIKMRHSFLHKNNNNSGGPVTVNNANNGGGGGVVSEELKRPPAGGMPTSPPQQQMLSPQQQQQGFDGHIQQQQQQTFQPHGGSPGGAMDRIRQLKMERSYMLERRQQLCRDGLLDRAATSQQQQQTPPLIPQGQPTAFYQPVGQPPLDGNCYEVMTTGSLNDSTMEVDYQQSHLDPSALVPEFSASDLNPHEFDKYLQITDNNRQFGVMR